MARVIVETDDHRHVLLDEGVHPVHMGDEHVSLQIIERIAWAVEEADVECPHLVAVPYRAT